MFKNYKILGGHVLGMAICDGGCHCIGAMCARIEAGNDWIEEHAEGLCSAAELGHFHLLVGIFVYYYHYHFFCFLFTVFVLLTVNIIIIYIYSHNEFKLSLIFYFILFFGYTHEFILFFYYWVFDDLFILDSSSFAQH